MQSEPAAPLAFAHLLQGLGDIDPETFPNACLWSLEKALDGIFWPE
jgi:hypothetical protein